MSKLRTVKCQMSLVSQRIRAAYCDILISDFGLETKYDRGFLFFPIVSKVHGGTVLYLAPWLLFLHPCHSSIQ